MVLALSRSELEHHFGVTKALGGLSVIRTRQGPKRLLTANEYTERAMSQQAVFNMLLCLSVMACQADAVKKNPLRPISLQRSP